jgi:hypothetical protein
MGAAVACREGVIVAKSINRVGHATLSCFCFRDIKEFVDRMKAQNIPCWNLAIGLTRK